MTFAPIILFAYKRVWHLNQTVNALQKNYLAGNSDLFIYSDGPKDNFEIKNINEVRSYLKTVNGFKSINIVECREHNGLANSIIAGVTEVLEKYKKIIVMEDDLVSSPNFLTFMNKALECYEKGKSIFSVSGYNYPILIPPKYKDPVYIAPRCSSWGWGTWVDRWKKADWEMKDYKNFLDNPEEQKKFAAGGEDLMDMLEYQMKNYIDSWAIRWCYAHYKNSGYCLYPAVSKIKNIGLDRTGTHKVSMKITVRLDTSSAGIFFPKNIQPNAEILSNFSAYFKKSRKAKIIKYAKNLIFSLIKV